MDFQTCKSCGHTGNGKYCNNCGQQYAIKRISLKGLLHDVFHFFTHLEKGFWYTFKHLIVSPGTMQRQYVEGMRSRYQKPFSMFLICASANAITRYWINNVLIRYYNAGDINEANFFHEYFVLVFSLLIPIVTLLNWLIFSRSKYNYAETGVLQLYSFSFFFIAVIPISLLKFIWHSMDTAWVESPLLGIYMMLTFLNFYKASPRWQVLLKAMVVIFLVFMTAQLAEDFVIKLLKEK